MLNPILGCLAAGLGAAFGQSAGNGGLTNEIRIVELQGTVEVSPAGAGAWMLTRTNQLLSPFDRLRTRAKSRVALRWSDASIVSFGASAELEILPPHEVDAQTGLHLVQGAVSFFHRDEPGRIRVITRGAVAGVEGTEFVLAVAAANGAERTTLSVIDGEVRFGNEQATIVVTNGEQALAETGRAPVRTAGFIANNVLQWCFYYPAVLDLADVQLAPDQEKILAVSLEAYRAGDLLAALANYPASRQPDSDDERVYYAALLLSVGEVEKAEATLALLSPADMTGRPQRLAMALRQLISAVKRQPNPSPLAPQLATEFLAGSYFEQSLAVRATSLEAALKQARQAATNSPSFGFAWARVAELEFSFGRTRAALDALDKSLSLTPRNAQALALKGLLIAAQNRPHDAITWFDRALGADSALANAWLGRGLCRIRRGDAIGGREDLLVAAALEPQRAGLRSYLGKGYANAGDYPRATRELQLAKNLDPQDPTPWLYSALLNQEHNRINEAIRDLEKSEELNDNRSVYRSQLLLDQDQAVRSANLAAMYRDAGMTDVAAREAARAVNYDYGNYSAHLFLANSYHDLRDPNLTNLRYETPSQAEYLVADLLAPVSAGPISSTISQQEYSPLFARNRLGVVSSTEYLSRGAWTESGAQYGTFDSFSYSAEAFYRSDPGQRVNNDLEARDLSLALKWQVTAQDTLFARAEWFKSHSGDLFQYYDPQMAAPGARVEEEQKPMFTFGGHHEWRPGMHTLFLFARLEDTVSVTNPFAPVLLTVRPDVSPGVTELVAVHSLGIHQQFDAELEVYSGELQQIWEQAEHNTVVGARFQYGHFDSANRLIDPTSYYGFFPTPPEPAAQTNITSLFRRFSIYGYHQWQVLDPLQLIGGVTYDLITFPENFRIPPITSGEETVDQVSPKAGLIWTPGKNTTARFAYTRSLAGASLDQSYQLEPPQVAGFVQSFRSIIPEPVAGPNAGAAFETYGLSLEQKFATGTYLGISGELLNSHVDRTVGTFDALPDQLDFVVASGLRQHLDYDERTLLVTANQLVGREWSLGGRYRLSQAVLREDFVDVPDRLPFNNADSPPARQRLEGLLHQLTLFAIYNHPRGFFTEAEALWYSQSNSGYSPELPRDDFWQFNAFVGYRTPRRNVEVMVGLLNIADQDYHLNPLNLYNELPRNRTLALRLRLNF